MAQAMLSNALWSLSVPATVSANKDSKDGGCHPSAISKKPKASLASAPKTKKTDHAFVAVSAAVNTESMSIERSHLCKKCARAFATMIELGEHACNSDPTESIPCPYCSHVANNRRMLNIHIPNCNGYRKNDLALKKEFLKQEASETINQDTGRIAQLIELATNNRGELNREGLSQSIKDYVETFFSDFCDKPDVEPLFARSAVKSIRAKLATKARTPVVEKKKTEMGAGSDKMEINPPEVLAPALALPSTPNQAPIKSFKFKIPRKQETTDSTAPAAVNAQRREITSNNKRKRAEKEASSGYFSDSESDSEDNVKSPRKRQRMVPTFNDEEKEKTLVARRLEALGDFMDLAPMLLKEEENVIKLKDELTRYETKLSRDKSDLSDMNSKPNQTPRFLEELRAEIEELEAAGEVIDEEVENEIGIDLVSRSVSIREKELEIEATKNAVVKSRRDLTNNERLFAKKLLKEAQPLLVRSGVLDNNGDPINNASIRKLLQSMLAKEKQKRAGVGSAKSQSSISTSSKYVCILCCDEEHDSFQCNPACGHVFCSSCMLRSRGSCPQCRKPYTSTIPIFLQ